MSVPAAAPTTSIFPFLDRARTIARPGYNRWLVPPAALAIHLAIGQVYAFSVFNLPLHRVIGRTIAVQEAAASTEGLLASPDGLGPLLAASALYPERNATLSAPDDWKLTTLGWIFSIAIVFLGLSAAVFGKWLEAAGPRKAMFAAAACFGGGFLVSAVGVWLHQVWLLYLGYGVLGGIGLGLGYISPVSTLIKWFPDRPGMATGLAIMGFGGGAMIGAPLAQTLMDYFATPTEVGVAETFVAMGLIYCCFMVFGVVMVRLPPPGWRPAGYTPGTGRALVAPTDVTADAAILTPQFWLLWAILFLNVTAGIGVLSQASPMIQEMFPGRVSVAVAAGFVGLLSLFNMVGRFCWSSLSDYIGRKATYAVYFSLGAALYALTPQTGRLGLLVLFVLAYGVIMSMYGGGFATVPAYLRDVFGTAQVGAIHGRLLTAWSAAGIAGPVLVNYIRKYQISRNVPPAEAYTVTMYIMAGLLVVGLVCDLLVRQLSGDRRATPEPVPKGPLHVDGERPMADPTRLKEAATSGGNIPLLIFSWLWVGIPLAWGVLETLRTSLALWR